MDIQITCDCAAIIVTTHAFAVLFIRVFPDAHHRQLATSDPDCIMPAPN